MPVSSHLTLALQHDADQRTNSISAWQGTMHSCTVSTYCHPVWLCLHMAWPCFSALPNAQPGQNSTAIRPINSVGECTMRLTTQQPPGRPKRHRRGPGNTPVFNAPARKTAIVPSVKRYVRRAIVAFQVSISSSRADQTHGHLSSMGLLFCAVRKHWYWSQH